MTRQPRTAAASTACGLRRWVAPTVQVVGGAGCRRYNSACADAITPCTHTQTGPEIISEASRRLPEDLKARHPHIPWRDMAAAGNIYRPDYGHVAVRRV